MTIAMAGALPLGISISDEVKRHELAKPKSDFRRYGSPAENCIYLHHVLAALFSMQEQQAVPHG